VKPGGSTAHSCLFLSFFIKSKELNLILFIYDVNRRNEGIEIGIFELMFMVKLDIIIVKLGKNGIKRV
jgi:hypothetical protein